MLFRSAGEGLLTQVSFTSFNGESICFGEDTGSSGGTAIADGNGAYIAADWGECFQVDDCEYDECGVCDGPGAIYECGCNGLPDGECDCAGNVVDCAGECGGSAVVDECGVCDGDGSTCEDFGGVSLEIQNVDTGAGTLDIYMSNYPGCSYCEDPDYNNNTIDWWDILGVCENIAGSTWVSYDPITEEECFAIPSLNGNGGWWFDGHVAGFQFELSNIEINDATAPAGFTMSTTSEMVLGFSLTGATIPPGSGLLTQVNFSGYGGGEICFGDDTGSAGSTAIADSYGGYIAANWGSCVMPDDYVPPQISLSPESLSSDLFTGATDTQLLTISNTGGAGLDWELSIEDQTDRQTAEDYSNHPGMYYLELDKGEEDPRIGPDVGRGSGGPDEFGYTWIDSDESGGPAFNWEDISGTGTPIYLSDDGYEQVALPFNFSFYDIEQSEIKISSNGFLTFGSDATAFTNQPIPQSDGIENIICPFWDDLNPYYGGMIYYYSDNDKFIVQYDGIYHYGSGGPYTFQVILNDNGSILYQ